MGNYFVSYRLIGIGGDMKFLIKLFVIFSFFLATTLLAREVEETFKKNIPVENATRLTVENTNGSIEISTWNRDEIGITAYKKVRADNEEDALKLLELLEKTGIRQCIKILCILILRILILRIRIIEKVLCQNRQYVLYITKRPLETKKSKSGSQVI